MNLDAKIVEALAADAAFADCTLECFTPDASVENGDGEDGFLVLPSAVGENEAEGYGGYRSRIEHQGVLGLTVRSVSLARLQAMVTAARTHMDTIRSTEGVLAVSLVGVTYTTDTEGSSEFLAVATYSVATQEGTPITGP